MRPAINSRIILVFASAVLTISACDQLKKRAISGEFRSDPIVVTSTGATEDTGTFTYYDFRSDGTYTYRNNLNILGMNQSIHAKGTYRVDGNKLLLTQTEWIHYTPDNPEGETHTEVSQSTLTIEPNGDLLQGHLRLKKQ